LFQKGIVPYNYLMELKHSLKPKVDAWLIQAEEKIMLTSISSLL